MRGIHEAIARELWDLPNPLVQTFRSSGGECPPDVHDFAAELAWLIRLREELICSGRGGGLWTHFVATAESQHREGKRGLAAAWYRRYMTPSGGTEEHLEQRHVAALVDLLTELEVASYRHPITPNRGTTSAQASRR